MKTDRGRMGPPAGTPVGMPSQGNLSRGYIINVASYKNGVGYGKWPHIDGLE